MTRQRIGRSAIAPLCLTLLSCSGGSKNDVTPPDKGDQDMPTDTDNGAGFDYSHVAWGFETIEVDGPSTPAGIQGKLLRAGNGTLFYAYLKFVNLDDTCNIAVFGGGSAPAINYELHVAVRAAGATTWSIETVPLNQVGPPDYALGRFGIDGVINHANQPVLSLAAGTAGLFSCGSGDLVLATRTGTNAWSVSAEVTASNAYGGAECPDPACTQGTDVGAWSAIAQAPDGSLNVTFTDYHNFSTEDGQTRQGYEMWQSGGLVTAIMPYVSQGNYADLIYAGGTLITAFAGYKPTGVRVMRRTGNSGTLSDWQQSLLFDSLEVGERLSLALAPDGTVGLAMHVIKTDAQTTVNDLWYCESTDGGATWTQICDNVDQPVLNLGYNPSLAYANDGTPVIAYRACGADCDASDDRLRIAWRNAPGDWGVVDVVAQASNREGLYAQLLLDPMTNAPTLAYQDLTLGSAVVATGSAPSNGSE